MAPSGHSTQIASDTIRLLQPTYFDQVRRVTATSEALPFAQQSDWPAYRSAQFHFVVENGVKGTKGWSIAFTGLGAPSRLSVNGAPVDWAHPVPPSGAFGRSHLIIDIPKEKLQSGPNRMDLIQPSRPVRAGLGGAHYATSPQGASALTYWQNVSHSSANWLNAATWLGLVSCLLGALVVKRRRPYLAALAMGLCLASPILPIFGTIEPIIRYAGSSFAAAMVAIFALILALVSCKGQSPSQLASAGWALAACLAAIVELLRLFGMMPPLGVGYAMAYTNLAFIPILALGLPLMLIADVRRMAQSLRQAREAVSQKDKIIAEKERALHDEIRQKAVLEERQRFMRDMHDGIGGQLLSLLLKVRGGAVSLSDVEREIQGGITDLRLVVDSLDHVGADLEQAMATFLTRSKQQLDAANVQIQFSQKGELGHYRLDSRHILNLYRILQEAVSNSVKHSGATRLEIGVQPLSGGKGLEITLADNGCGFDAAVTPMGKGLKNMRARAEAMQAAFHMESNSAGTLVRLTLPELVLHAASATL